MLWWCRRLVALLNDVVGAQMHVITSAGFFCSQPTSCFLFAMSIARNRSGLHYLYRMSCGAAWRILVRPRATSQHSYNHQLVILSRQGLSSRRFPWSSLQMACTESLAFGAHTVERRSATKGKFLKPNISGISQKLFKLAYRFPLWDVSWTNFPNNISLRLIVSYPFGRS